MIAASLGFCAGLIATVCVVLVARRFHFTCRPQSNRWNSREVALHGGIGVGAAFLVTAVYLWRPYWGRNEYLLLALPFVMMITGFIDDIYGLTPLPKLITEVSVALAAVYSGFIFTLSGSMFFDGLITVFWIVGVINSVNMLDNIDGATGGTLIISLSGILLISGGGAEGVSVLIESLCGVLLGFLVFNFHPARIFLGDSGSLFLGCFAALTAVKCGSSLPGHIVFNAVPQSFIVVILIFAVSILDTSFVVINRKLNGYSAMNGDRGHIAHRLAVLCKSDKMSVVTLYSYQTLVIAMIYWKMFAMLIPLAIATIYALYKLTVRTNQLVWPGKVVNSS